MSIFIVAPMFSYYSRLSLARVQRDPGVEAGGVGTLIHGVVRFRQRKGRDLNIKLLGSLIDHLVGATH